MRLKTNLLTLVVAAGLAGLITGCSGSGAGHAPAARPAPLSDATAASGALTPSHARSGGGAFCAVLRQEIIGYKKVFPKDFTRADQLKAFGEYSRRSSAQLLAIAPDEIRSALETQDKATKVLTNFYLNGTKPPPSALRQLNTPQVRAAAQQLATYGKTRCGLTPATVGG